MSLTFEGTRRGYLALWQRMEIRPERIAEADVIVKRVLVRKADYEAVEQATGVPWFLVAGLHSRESSLNFSTYLGNGQPLNRVTTEVPAGRGPFASFAAGAIDALAGLRGIADWPVERIAYEAERFNGEGYFSVGINSPYLWAWSDLYSTGKFIADHQFSSAAADPQCGVMVLIKRIAAADASVAARIAPPVPLPQPAPPQSSPPEGEAKPPPPDQGAYQMNPLILVQLFTAIPSLVQAVETILASDAGHTIENAVLMLIGHNTAGQPNVAALGPTAKPSA